MKTDSSARMLQCLRRLPNGPLVKQTLSVISDAYAASSEPWVIGYSGGKDSTAVVKLIFQSLLRCDLALRPVTVIYCDTGVEIPLAAELARQALRDLDAEARAFDLPIRTRVLSPRLRDRFFVKILGRGYAPPTDKFRWCTDRLRIDPVTRFLASEDVKSATVVLGVRAAESPTRRHTLGQYGTDDRYWQRQKGISNRRLFMPIIDFSTTDVWLTNLLTKYPQSLCAQEVAELYASASGECPTVRDVKGAPCGKARFGCWTCTVAKNGVTLRHLISSGEMRLKPLLDFRLWLDRERKNPRNRWTRRRDGSPGPGPMTLPWRRRALDRLLRVQNESGFVLLLPEEVAEIHRLWEME